MVGRGVGAGKNAEPNNYDNTDYNNDRIIEVTYTGGA